MNYLLSLLSCKTPARPPARSGAYALHTFGKLGNRGPLTFGLSSQPTICSVIVLVGLAFEARIAAGRGATVIRRSAKLGGLVQQALRGACQSIISFGVAGALIPDLRAGDCVVASAIADAQTVKADRPDMVAAVI